MKDIIISGLLALLIVMSHYGTFAALTLYGFAVFISFSIVSQNRKCTLISGFTLVLSVVISVATIFLFDPQRFERIFIYLNNSIASSLLFSFFKSGINVIESMISLGLIAILYLIFFLFYRIYKQYKSGRC